MTQVKAANPDVLLNSGYMADEVKMVKAAKELKFMPKYMGSLGLPIYDFMKALGKDSDYLFDGQWWMPESGWKGPFFGSSQEYAQLFKQKFNEDPTYYSAAASAGGLVLQTAIEKAGSLDVEKVREQLAKTDMETLDRPELTYPPDKPQIEHHLRRANGTEPTLMAFEVVSVASQDTSGQVYHRLLLTQLQQAERDAQSILRV